MAWTFLAASADSPLLWRHGSDQSPIVRSIATAKPYFSAAWHEESWPSPLFGMTSVPSGPAISLPSTSSMAVFPARTSALRAMARGWAASAAVFFSRSCGWPTKSSPHSYSWRTSQRSAHEGCAWSLKSWPRAATMRAGIVCPLTTWERRIGESGGGASLPTPSASSYGSNKGGAAGRMGKARPSLETMPRQALWPTPKASDGQKGGPNSVHGNGSLSLPAAVRQWATPTSRDWKSGSHGAQGNSRPLSEQIGGSLSPMWVEWLMGYPIGWTALEAWAIAWYRPARVRRSAASLGSRRVS